MAQMAAQKQKQDVFDFDEWAAGNSKAIVEDPFQDSFDWEEWGRDELLTKACQEEWVPKDMKATYAFDIDWITLAELSSGDQGAVYRVRAVKQKDMKARQKMSAKEIRADNERVAKAQPKHADDNIVKVYSKRGNLLTAMGPHKEQLDKVAKQTAQRWVANEVKVLLRVEGQGPFFPQIIQTYETDEVVCVVMKRYGMAASEMIMYHKPRQLYGLRYLYQMMQAMLRLHQLDIVHHDAHAKNWIFTGDVTKPETSILLIDFGLSRILKRGTWESAWASQKRHWVADIQMVRQVACEMAGLPHWNPASKFDNENLQALLDMMTPEGQRKKLRSLDELIKEGVKLGLFPDEDDMLQPVTAEKFDVKKTGLFEHGYVDENGARTSGGSGGWESDLGGPSPSPMRVSKALWGHPVFKEHCWLVHQNGLLRQQLQSVRGKLHAARDLLHADAA